MTVSTTGWWYNLGSTLISGIRASFLPTCRPLEARYPDKLAGQRILAEMGIYKISTFVVLWSLKEKILWGVQLNTAASVTTWEMVTEGSLNSQNKDTSFVLQNLAQKKWIVPSESSWGLNRIQPSVSSLGLSAKAEEETELREML